MSRLELESQFTSMLVNTQLATTYANLMGCYLIMDGECNVVPLKDRPEKLRLVRESDPKVWITKLFTEGLDIPEKLYKVNILWLKHLEDIGWE